jgi:hypothetical protein
MNRVLIAALFLCACNACGGAPAPLPITPEPKPDPHGPVDQDVCDRFCAFLDQRNCAGEEGSPGADEKRGNADDVPCAQVCRDVLSKGTYLADERCLGTATNCEGAESCVFGP